MGIFSKLPFFKKAVQNISFSWDEQDPEHYCVIHHVLYGYSASTSIPNGYPEVFNEDEIKNTLEKARQSVENLNLNVTSAAALDRLIELRAARIFYDKLLCRHHENLLSAYRTRSDVQLQRDEIQAFITIREEQLKSVQNQIDELLKDQ
ncbi:MAG: hypothetical protein MR715_10820 [Subdoligranulum sp.]|nr:hypothetical protein [Subdoligranulum sp.]